MVCAVCEENIQFPCLFFYILIYVFSLLPTAPILLLVDAMWVKIAIAVLFFFVLPVRCFFSATRTRLYRVGNVAPESSRTRLWGDVLITNLETKQTTTLAAGSPMSLGCVRTGLRLSFQCKQGTCQSCEFLLDGKITRACITKVPDKKSITVKSKPLKR